MIFSSKKIIAIVVFIVFCGRVAAQTEGIQLRPQPQIIEQPQKRFIAQHSYHITGIKDADAMGFVTS